MKASALYLRTVIFGVTDSLVSTVGLLAGLAIAGATPQTLALTGIVYAFVEAFSMAIGNYLSEESAEEYTTGQEAGGRRALGGAVLMFIAFVLASFIPIVPYLLFTIWTALIASIAFSIIALFVLGLLSGYLTRLPVFRRGLRMALLGGAAIIIGALVGLVLQG